MADLLVELEGMRWAQEEDKWVWNLDDVGVFFGKIGLFKTR